MIEKISLEISNYWTSNDFLTESNKNCGTLVAFDWIDEDEIEFHLSEINTNIDLSDLEIENFKFDVFVDFLRKNNFNQVLGLKNIGFKDNPSPEWTDKLKETLKFNEIEYDEYIIGRYPHRIPEFDVQNNVFILRYSFDSYNKVDALAAHWFLFESFIKESGWKKYFNQTGEVKYWHNDWSYKERSRVIVFCSNIENLVLHDGFDK